MSWTGEYWGKKGAVSKAEEKYEASGKLAVDCTEFASVCFSATNRVFADMQNLRWREVKHLPQAILLAFRVVRLADWGYLKISMHEGSKDSLAASIDIICSIYARYGFLFGGRRKTLKKLITRSTNSSVNRLLMSCSLNDKDIVRYVKPHTQAFLHLHKVNFYGKKIRREGDVYQKVENLFKFTVAGGGKEQACRIARKLAAVVKDKKLSLYYLNLAKKLAQASGATDQSAKI